MKGYFRHPDLTTDTLRGGWLHTGDLGHLDERGYLHLTGLKKRMLNVSGRKIYPAEVERLMRLNDNLVDVHIYGKPTEIQGESVQGRVTLRTKGPQAEEAFRSWCEKRITGYKIPRRIEFV